MFTFPSFYFWFEFTQRICEFAFLWEIVPEVRCSIGYCLRAISYCFLFSFNIIWKFLKLCVFSLNIKKLSMIGGAYPFIILKTSIITTCKFFWWIVISLFFSNKLSTLLSLSPLTIRIDLSCNLLMRLLDFLEENIQMKGQELNWDFIIPLKISYFWYELR